MNRSLAPAYRAAIFDLDGVIVDTSEHHFLAWTEVARALSIDLSRADNEKLKGVGRMEGLDIILGLGGKTLESAEKESWVARKSAIFRNALERKGGSRLLPGAGDYLRRLKAIGIPIALGSASRDAVKILERTGIRDLFDVIVDGSTVSKSKPDPEVFIQCALLLGIRDVECVVFEDSMVGIAAAKAAGMAAVGIGDPAVLSGADLVFPGLHAAGISFFRTG